MERKTWKREKLRPTQPFFVLDSTEFLQESYRQMGISHFYQLKKTQGMPLATIPDACIDFLFSFEKDGTMTALVRGTSLMFRRDLLPEATDIFGVRFMPGTHPAGLSLKLHDLIGLRLPLRDCLPESFDFDGLARQKTFVTRVRFFLKEYAKLYHLQKEPDPFGKEALFDAVCELIYQTDGPIRISELSEHTSYTDRYIRKVFQEEMGFPPKTFCNILRFQRAIEFINYGYEEKTADWMTALGYYDQAQCVRDFRKYLGMTPNRYRKLVRASSYEQRATYAHDLGLRI